MTEGLPMKPTLKNAGTRRLTHGSRISSNTNDSEKQEARRTETKMLKPAPRVNFRSKRLLMLAALGLAGFGATYGIVRIGQRVAAPAGMRWIAGGEFTMGTDSDLGWADEKPAHRGRGAGFWMDETDVPNARCPQ